MISLHEHIWLETRRMTGGARDTLDLSKLGRVINGSGTGSRYETENASFILGSVAFFDIQPEDTAVRKNITVNYSGSDYPLCLIEFAPRNGSWRIHLSGQNEGGVSLSAVCGNHWLVNKILVFEKIRTDYYSLSVLESEDLTTCRAASYVTACNGISRNAKEYGLL